MIKVTVTSFLLMFILAISLPINALPGKSDTRVTWISLEQLQQLSAESKKPILIDVYTDWCYYCKVMDKTTWQNDSVAAYLADKYYTVKLNAENKEPCTWEGKTYNYEPRYKVNLLSVKLLGGNMVFPSTVIIPVKGEPEVLKGAYRANELEMIIKYYGERANETTTPEAFMKKFSGKWK
jgi:thioredoxin-related protein